MEIVKLLGAVVLLAGGIFAWWVKKNDEKKKAIADEDAKIDTLDDADSIMRGDK